MAEEAEANSLGSGVTTEFRSFLFLTEYILMMGEMNDFGGFQNPCSLKVGMGLEEEETNIHCQ